MRLLGTESFHTDLDVVRPTEVVSRCGLERGEILSGLKTMRNVPHPYTYQVLSLLGQGSYADVFLVECVESFRKLACKVVLPRSNRASSRDSNKKAAFGPRRESSRGSRASLPQTSLANVLEEAKVVKSLEHELVLSLTALLRDQRHIYLLSPWLRYGSLESFVKARSPLCRLPINLLRKVVAQLFTACQFVHSKGVIHRDIKGHNILLADDLTIRICDFGLAKKIPKRLHTNAGAMQSRLEAPMPDPVWSRSLVGTPNFVAPEVIKRRGYGNHADVWSMGVVIYSLLCGFCPFESPQRLQWHETNIELFASSGKTCSDPIPRAESPRSVFHNITNNPLQFPSDIEEVCQRYHATHEAEDESRDIAACVDLIKTMLVKDPSQRPTWEVLLEHAFITGEFYERLIPPVDENDSGEMESLGPHSSSLSPPKAMFIRAVSENPQTTPLDEPYHMQEYKRKLLSRAGRRDVS
ncbi:MAG: uncharacterized protein KVP18_001492 [Porospora cf. gigantea A]|uniref:uncharacterized protein n=2 Tax=Porospora cf. gigantea A TaxID=2853593 RepID=UPI00355A5642|nr:MAG: hypothetical protein KVP18_001492 [Porospora cf. gigantea A]